MKRFLSQILVTLFLLAPAAWGAKTTFVDGNASTKTPGTRVTAAFLNATNNHRHDGKAVDGSGVLDYAADTGSANALAVALSPALTAHVTGMPIYLKVAATNTGAATIAVDALAAKPLKKIGNTDLAAGDLHIGQLVSVAYDGTNYQLLHSPSTTDATTLQGQSAAMLAPPGAVLDFAMQVCPSGWTETDGSAILRAQYSTLFSAIGTTWGTGDGVTTFNKPDFRGEFRRSWDHGRGADTGRGFATFQDHAIQDHTHSGVPAIVGDADEGTQQQTVVGTQNSGGMATGNVAAETRPRNVSVLTCIKY